MKVDDLLTQFCGIPSDPKLRYGRKILYGGEYGQAKEAGNHWKVQTVRK